MKEFVAGLENLQTEAGDAPDLSLVPSVLTLSTSPREYGHSKKNPVLWALCRTVQGFLASGQTVDELFLEGITPEYRYRKGDILKSLRLAHRTHKATTRMGLVRGIWRVCPISITGTCKEYSCTSRLVCARERR